jgi:ornithine cyclodeaminase/alanine dehydrogenase-like protein (mu-crystallin family)
MDSAERDGDRNYSTVFVNEADARKAIGAKAALTILENFFRDRSRGATITPPRWHVNSANGDMAITAGGSEAKSIIGFRAYTTYGADDQLIAVFDMENGSLKGIVTGSYIGSIRTAAIGSLSIKYMARKDSSVLGIIGSGTQAFFQTVCALETMPFTRVLAYSPNRDHLEMFASRVMADTGKAVRLMGSAKEVADEADVLILATRSSDPVIFREWVRDGSHIISVGKKFIDEHELDAAIPSICSVIATDSLDQLESYPEKHFMESSPLKASIVELSDIISSKKIGRIGRDDVTLFLSVGLSGTEVMIANEAIERLRARGIQKLK